MTAKEEHHEGLRRIRRAANRMEAMRRALEAELARIEPEGGDGYDLERQFGRELPDVLEQEEKEAELEFELLKEKRSRSGEWLLSEELAKGWPEKRKNPLWSWRKRRR